MRYTELFELNCPYYMAIGMTYEEFWDKDSTLVRYYKKADELRRDQRNHDMWLQGAYFYSALCSAAPAFRAFSKHGPNEYLDAPFPLSERSQEEENRKRLEASKAAMIAMAANINQHRRRQNEQ